MTGRLNLQGERKADREGLTNRKTETKVKHRRARAWQRRLSQRRKNKKTCLLEQLMDSVCPAKLTQASSDQGQLVVAPTMHDELGTTISLFSGHMRPTLAPGGDAPHVLTISDNGSRLDSGLRTRGMLTQEEDCPAGVNNPPPPSSFADRENKAVVSSAVFITLSYSASISSGAKDCAQWGARTPDISVTHDPEFEPSWGNVSNRARDYHRKTSWRKAAQPTAMPPGQLSWLQEDDLHRDQTPREPNSGLKRIGPVVIRVLLSSVRLSLRLVAIRQAIQVRERCPHKFRGPDQVLRPHIPAGAVCTSTHQAQNWGTPPIENNRSHFDACSQSYEEGLSSSWVGMSLLWDTPTVIQIEYQLFPLQKVAHALAWRALVLCSHGALRSGIAYPAPPHYQIWTYEVSLRDMNWRLKFSIRNGEIFISNPFPTRCQAYLSQDHHLLDAQTGSADFRTVNYLPSSPAEEKSLHFMGKLKKVLVKSMKFIKAKKPNSETYITTLILIIFLVAESLRGQQSCHVPHAEYGSKTNSPIPCVNVDWLQLITIRLRETIPLKGLEMSAQPREILTPTTYASESSPSTAQAKTTVPLKREEWKHGPAAEIATLQSNHENPSQPRIINNQHSHHSLQSLTGVLINLLGYQIDKQLILRIFKKMKLARSNSRVPPRVEVMVPKEGKILSNDLELKGQILLGFQVESLRRRRGQS
ncbi:hypothetical protein VP01_473g2 [Puccinia sorghi]|uniref:Uncharacterized protein n=1 Tax=Puccinia sorghi TaxID=27349 RepID=A0A0L6UPW0_9BASI|nr:hypothetical protein VP01_473g2 [Puccinia sorghi]